MKKIINEIKENKRLQMVLTVIPVVLLVVVLVSAISFSKNDSLPNNISSEQVISGIKISDGIIIQDKGIYNYTAKVTNTNNEKSKVEIITLTFYDIENKKMVTLYGYVGRELEPNETVPISASVDKDISGANRVEIELNKKSTID